MASTSVISNWKWMLDCLVSLIFVILNEMILLAEIRKRKKSNNIIKTNSVKFWPIICISCGLLVEIFGLIAFLPGICLISRKLEFILSVVQGVSMGFFQLSCLYSLFKSTSNAYSNIVFAVMYATGVIILALVSVASFFMAKIEYCLLDKKYNYIEHTSYFYNNKNVIYWIIGCILLYIIWDIITLILYIWKLIPFYRNEEKKSTSNTVKSILYKMIILTAMYEITIIFLLNDIYIEMSVDIGVVHEDSILLFIFLESLLSVSMSYAIFLMQQHNADQYRKLLKIIHYLKCDIICCCCCASVIHDEIKKDQSEHQTQASSDQRTSNQMTLTTIGRPQYSKLTVKTVPTSYTRSSENQGCSKTKSYTKTKTGSAPVGVPTLKRDTVSDIGGSSTTDTFADIAMAQSTVASLCM
eukprot:261061_1